MPMVADREHLYGRDVIPLAFLAQVVGDRAAARCEVALAERLGGVPGVPAGRPPREVLGRVQVRAGSPRRTGHQLPAARVAGPVRGKRPCVRCRSASSSSRPVASPTTGRGPGLVSHQSPGAWSGAVGKSGFVKFAWQPAHDDWLFALSGATPMFLPQHRRLKVTGRSVVTYSRTRDGFDGSASLLTLDRGYAGFTTTLPSGADRVRDLRTGVRRGPLGGAQPEHARDARAGRQAHLSGGRGKHDGRGRDAGRRGITPPPTRRRTHLSACPVPSSAHAPKVGAPHPSYGYSLYALEIRDGASGPDLAREAGRQPPPPPSTRAREPRLAVDGTHTSRWAVSARTVHGRTAG